MAIQPLQMLISQLLTNLDLRLEIRYAYD